MPRGAIAHVLENGDNTVTVITTPCIMCRKRHEFVLNKEAFDAWQTDTKIQDAFPELSQLCKKPILKGEEYVLRVIMTTEDSKPWQYKRHYICDLGLQYGED